MGTLAQPRTAENRINGKLLVTNIGRRLQLIIRYACGDLAEWVDYVNGEFRVLGREGLSVQVGAVVIDTGRLRHIVLGALAVRDLSAFQVVISRADLRDVMTLRVGDRAIGR
jgi:phenylacetate-CoA ligase